MDHRPGAWGSGAAKGKWEQAGPLPSLAGSWWAQGPPGGEGTGGKPGPQWVEGREAGEGGPVPSHLDTALQVIPSYSPLSPCPPSLEYGR